MVVVVEMLDRDENVDGGGDGGGRWGEDVVAVEMVMKLVLVVKVVVVVDKDVRLMCVDASRGECVRLSGTLVPRHANCKTEKSAVKARTGSRGIMLRGAWPKGGKEMR